MEALTPNVRAKYIRNPQVLQLLNKRDATVVQLRKKYPQQTNEWIEQMATSEVALHLTPEEAQALQETARDIAHLLAHAKEAQK